MKNPFNPRIYFRIIAAIAEREDKIDLLRNML